MSIFRSAEIRWFANDKEPLWLIFRSMSGDEHLNREPERIDYYLRGSLSGTGVKVREGNHEIKVRASKGEHIGYGKVERWVKWSTPEDRNVLNTIPADLLGDWVALHKLRWLRTYNISSPEPVSAPSDIFLDEGCHAEFTVVTFPESEQTVYTLGLEAFSSTGTEQHNLLATLPLIEEHASALGGTLSCGYPEYLSSLPDA